jgi:ribosomal protein S18 acetylase RimI-like enzyme
MTEENSVTYAHEPDLDVAAFCQVLLDSSLGATRPVNDPARITKMLAQADLVMTARLNTPGRTLIGVARCITDFSWRCYVAEIAVAKTAQGLGVGKTLLAEIRRYLGPQVSVILASVPESVSFYERIGMPRMPDTFCFRRDS